MTVPAIAKTALFLLGALLDLGTTSIPDSAVRPGSLRQIADDHGARQRLYLIQPVEIDGVSWTGWTWLDGEGNLLHSELAEDHAFHGIIFPAGSTVFFKDGIVTNVWLAHDMVIDGLPVNGGGKIDTGFHPNGRLRVCFLDKDTVIRGVPCHASTLAPVYFDSSGALLQCTLSKNYLNNGSLYRAGSEVWLYPDGSVRTWDSPEWLERMGKGALDVVF